MKTAKEIWYSRNPQHEINSDTGEDMFMGTAMICMEEYAKQMCELAFDAGWHHCDRTASPLVGNESWQTPPPPNKEQFIKELFK
jgi:hypothetical protein